MVFVAAGRFRTTTLMVTLSAVAMVGLSGCVGSPKSSPTSSSDPTPSASVSASSSPSASASPAPPSATPSVPANGKPVTIGCNSLISAQAMYDFNTNFGLDTGFMPRAGSAAAIAVADGGVACNWINQTSGDTVTFSVARPGTDKLLALKSTAASGTPVSGVGDAAYFRTVSGSGRVDVFSGDYWLVGTSVYFSSASEAAHLLKVALGALH